MEITIYNRGDYEGAVAAMKDPVEEAGYGTQWPGCKWVNEMWGDIGTSGSLGTNGGLSRSKRKGEENKESKLADYNAIRKISRFQRATIVTLSGDEELVDIAKQGLEAYATENSFKFVVN